MAGPPPVLGIVIQQAATAGIGLAADWIRNRPVSAGPAPESAGDSGHDEDGCPACRLHAELAESKGLLEAMVLKAEPDGSVPRQYAATIVLVDMHLRLAQGHLDTIARERPDLQPAVTDVRAQLDSASAALPEREGLTRESADRARFAVAGCWASAVDLAGAYFTAGPGPEPAPLADLEARVRSLAPDERRALLARLAEE